MSAINITDTSIALYGDILKTLEALDAYYTGSQKTGAKPHKNLLCQLEASILTLQSQNAWDPHINIQKLAHSAGQNVCEFCMTYGVFNSPIQHMEKLTPNEQVERAAAIPDFDMPLGALVGAWGREKEKINVAKFIAQADLALDVFIRHGYDINQKFLVPSEEQERTTVLQINRNWPEQEVFDWLKRKNGDYAQLLQVDTRYPERQRPLFKELARRTTEIYHMCMRRERSFLDFLHQQTAEELTKDYLEAQAPKAVSENSTPDTATATASTASFKI